MHLSTNIANSTLQIVLFIPFAIIVLQICCEHNIKHETSPSHRRTLSSSSSSTKKPRGHFNRALYAHRLNHHRKTVIGGQFNYYYYYMLQTVFIIHLTCDERVALSLSSICIVCHGLEMLTCGWRLARTPPAISPALARECNNVFLSNSITPKTACAFKQATESLACGEFRRRSTTKPQPANTGAWVFVMLLLLLYRSLNRALSLSVFDLCPRNRKRFNLQQGPLRLRNNARFVCGCCRNIIRTPKNIIYFRNRILGPHTKTKKGAHVTIPPYVCVGSFSGIDRMCRIELNSIQFNSVLCFVLLYLRKAEQRGIQTMYSVR